MDTESFYQERESMSLPPWASVMPAPQQMDRRTFLAQVRQSGLLTDEELMKAEKHLPVSNRGRSIARNFIEKGLLTRFQAERLLVGRTAGFLLGQYRVLDQIGRGGMGRVFKAEHRTMGRIVALKVLAPDPLRTDRAQELFLHEVRAAAQLVHPNIVTAYDANEIDGRYFLVLEYVDGPNLEQLVRRQGPLPVGQACDYVRQIAVGLQCAHLLGMVHRDVKPANILVQRRGLNGDDVGLVKISDFGLARLSNPNAADEFSDHPGTILTKDNTVSGTPDYLSPEQAQSLHKTDIRSDLYSVGCTFYFLLTGQVVFPGGGTLDKLIRHGAEKAADVRDARRKRQPRLRPLSQSCWRNMHLTAIRRRRSWRRRWSRLPRAGRRPGRRCRKRSSCLRTNRRLPRTPTPRFKPPTNCPPWATRCRKGDRRRRGPLFRFPAFAPASAPG